MGLFDAYPTHLKVLTDISETLSDYTIFMWYRMWFNGSDSAACLINRGVTSDIWVGRDGGSDLIGGGFAGAANKAIAGAPATNTWYPLSVRRTTASTQLTTKMGGSTANNNSIGTADSNAGRNFMIGTNFDGGGRTMGGIVRLGIWNVALTDGELNSLEKGFSPTRIRPQSLLVYAPFIDKKNATFGNKLIGTGGGADTFSMSNGDGVPLIGVY